MAQEVKLQSGWRGTLARAVWWLLLGLSVALFVPLRNRVQNALDRRFNRSKYDARQILARFAQTVRDETDLERLARALVGVVDETMQPRDVSLWLAAPPRARRPLAPPEGVE